VNPKLPGLPAVKVVPVALVVIEGEVGTIAVMITSGDSDVAELTATPVAPVST
jgi:hypothetical protein